MKRYLCIMFILFSTSVVSASPTEIIVEDESSSCRLQGMWETSSYGTTHGGGKHFNAALARTKQPSVTPSLFFYCHDVLFGDIHIARYGKRIF